MFLSESVHPRLLMMASLLVSALWWSPRARAVDPHGSGHLPDTVTLDEVEVGGLLLRTNEDGVYLPAPEVRSLVEMNISGLMARIEVTQLFYNPGADPVEAVYVFPLPEKGAVHQMRMLVGDRLIEGKIKERREARAVYKRAKESGKSASLLEQQRPNMFTMSIANLGPAQDVLVQIGVQVPVDYEDGTFRLRFPLVVAPRYSPGERPKGGTADFSLATSGSLSHPRFRDPQGVSSPLRPEEAGYANPVNVRIHLHPGAPTERIESLSHRIAVRPAGKHSREIELAAGMEPARKDFVLEWRLEASHEPRSLVFTERVDGETYVLLHVLPPTGGMEAGVVPRDLLFVLDTSGSMSGASIQQAKEAVSLALALLRRNDRFNIIQFNDESSRLFPSLVPATGERIRQARKAVASLEAEGGTEMVPALSAALSGEETPGRLRQVVFLTDGAVENETELFEMILQKIGNTRLFPVGIGSAPNGFLLRKAAERGRGCFTFIGEVSEVRHRMEALFEKLSHPVLTGLELTQHGVDQGEMFPRVLPDLYLDQPLVVTMRANSLPEAVTLTGRVGGRPWTFHEALSQEHPVPGVASIWARSKIAALSDSLLESADPDLIRKDIIQVGLAHQLVSKYTSFVAVDVTPSGSEGARSHQRVIPANIPEGWEFAKLLDEAPVRKVRWGRVDCFLTPSGGPESCGLLGDTESVGPYPLLSVGQGATPGPLYLFVGALLLGAGSWFCFFSRFYSLRRPDVLFLCSQAWKRDRNRRRIERLKLVLVGGTLIAGALFLARGLYIPFKAAFADALLRSSWARTLGGEEQVRPWPSADTHTVGRLRVPRLGIDRIVLAGATGRTLAFGPGHLDGTAAPGDAGNTVLCGHRDTHFRFLADLEPGDRISMEGRDGRARCYVVRDRSIVDHRRAGIELDVEDPTLTLVTCYPFDALVPGGPDRFVVRAVEEG